MEGFYTIKSIVSVNLNNYDSVIENHYSNPGWRFVMFSNTPVKKGLWEHIAVAPEHFIKRQTRRYKWLIHKYLECEYSLYIDANIRILCNLDELIKKYLNGADIAMYKHRVRNCLYEEAKEIIRFKVDNPNVVKKQILKYKKDSYPFGNGLNEGTVILRRHTDRVNYLSEYVYSEIQNGSYRDQLAFNYCAWKLGVKVGTIDGMIKLYPEAKENLEAMLGKKIEYINPYFEMDKHV